MRRLLALVSSFVAIAASALAAAAWAGDPVDARLYATNAFNNRVDVYDAETGLAIGSFGAEQLNNPFGITVGPDGTVWVADTGNNEIDAFTPDGTPTQTIPGGQFVAPTDVVVDERTGQLYVTYGGSDAVVTYDANGAFLSSFSTGLGSGPRSLTFGLDGNIYVSTVGDGGNFGAPPGPNDQIAVFTAFGTLVRNIGTGGTGPGQFNNPVGVVFNQAADRMLVLDTNNNRVQTLGPLGSFIGQFGSFGTGDGQFFFPLGFAQAEDEIFVADSFNDRIQVLTSNGTFLRKWPSNLPTDVALAASEVGPSITSTPPTEATVGEQYTYKPVASGLSQPATWSLVDAPAGMTVDGTTGEVRWTPDAPGDFTVTLSVANDGGAFTTQSWTIHVNPAEPPPTGQISAQKFEDTNGDGRYDADEPPLSGWEVFVDLNENGALDPGEPTGTTDAEGRAGFENLAPDDYVVAEVGKPGWRPLDGVRAPVSPETITLVELPNFAFGQVGGVVFEDEDQDGARDPGEAGLGNWTVFFDWNGNGVQDAGEPTATTNSEGVYDLSPLGPSNGQLQVVLQEGRTLTTSPGDPFAITSGLKLTRDLGVTAPPGSVLISGTKFEDLDGDGTRDEGEPGLGGWTIFVDRGGNNVLDPGEPTTTTDANGRFSFGPAPPGEFRIREVAQSGWQQTTESVDLTLDPGAEPVVEIGNFKLGRAGGVVFHDLDGDKQRGSGEPGLAGWSLLFDRNGNRLFDPGETMTATGIDGNFLFTDLLAGQGAIVVQTQPGWQASDVDVFQITVTSGLELTQDFGFVQPLLISGLDATSLGPHDVKVTFTTNRNATALLRLGAPLDRDWPEGTAPGTNHVIVVSGLEPLTSFVMDVIAEGEDGRTATAAATGESAALGEFIASLAVDPVTGVVGVTFTANPATLTTQLTGSERYVAQAYRDLLGREIDPAGVGFWTGVLAGGTRADVALGLQQTDEFRGAVVAGMYQTFLGRAATPSEVAAGASSLQTVSRQAVAAQILGSAEYFTRAGDENAAWVTRLYQDVLHREATTGEAGAVLGALSAGQTREAAALDVLTSQEALTNVVRGAYQRYLHREASPGEVDFFFNRLSDERLAAALVGSSEYFAGLPASDEIVARAGTATVETGDGRTVAGALGRTGANTFRVSGDLNYDAAGTYDLGVTVFDGANVVVGATTAEIRAELGVNLVPDATDPTKTELRVVGTSADDTITVDRPGGGAIRVVLNGVPAGLFSPTGRIVVDALAGNDTVNISSTISRRSWVFGGSGDDIVNANASGGHVLVGGEGNDRLSGGAGRDLLIGGNGADVVGGGGDDDILLGGPTTLDADTAALAAVLAEWSSTDSYAVKVDNLTRFFGPGTTVLNDGEPDELRGARARDWFLAALNDFTDAGSGETVTLIP
jgi:DNA-binding beta-propeller fold protein YncE